MSQPPPHGYKQLHKNSRRMRQRRTAPSLPSCATVPLLSVPEEVVLWPMAHEGRRSAYTELERLHAPIGHTSPPISSRRLDSPPLSALPPLYDIVQPCRDDNASAPSSSGNTSSHEQGEASDSLSEPSPQGPDAVGFSRHLQWRQLPTTPKSRVGQSLDPNRLHDLHAPWISHTPTRGGCSEVVRMLPHTPDFEAIASWQRRHPPSSRASRRGTPSRRTPVDDGSRGDDSKAAHIRIREACNAARAAMAEVHIERLKGRRALLQTPPAPNGDA